jgi:hypothetical protein
VVPLFAVSQRRFLPPKKYITYVNRNFQASPFPTSAFVLFEGHSSPGFEGVLEEFVKRARDVRSVLLVAIKNVAQKRWQQVR